MEASKCCMMGESQNRVNSLSWTARALVCLSVALFIVIHSFVAQSY